MRTTTPKVALLALLLVLAGCGGGGGGTTTAPAPTMGDGNGSTPNRNTAAQGTPQPGQNLNQFGPRTDRGRRFVELAESNGVPVRAAFTNNGTFTVFYEVQPGAATEGSQRGFKVAKAYMTVVNRTWGSNATWNATAMDATAITPDGTPVTSYRMPAYWGRQVRVGVYDERDLAKYLDGARSRVAPNGSFEEVTGNLTQFGRAVSRVQNGTVTGLTRRGDTVYLTLHSGTQNRSRLENRLTLVTTVFGRFSALGWDPARLEMTVVRPDGDVYGWYYAEDEWARAASERGDVRGHAFMLDTFYPENDGLDG